MTTKAKRQVWIHYRPQINSYFVRFAERKRHGKHMAAQFSAKDRTIEHVKQWVIDNGLELVDGPAEGCAPYTQ